MSKKRWLALFLSVVLVLSMGISPAMAANEAIKGDIMIYTSIYPEIIDIINGSLKTEFPNLNVEWFQGGTGTVMSKMAAEIESDTIGCDILMVADPSYNVILKGEDLLHPYVSVHHDAIKEKDPEGYWYAVRGCNMIIAYNEDKTSVDDIPHTWVELAEDERFKGRIAMPDPSKSGTATVAAGTLGKIYGNEYFDKLAANGMVVEAGNNGINDKLLTGEYIAAMILEENILKLREESQEPLKVYYPDDGTIHVPSAICTLNTSENLEACEAITDFLLSPAGQEAFIAGWMHSVRNDFTKYPFDAKPTEEIMTNILPVDWDYLAASLEQIKADFRTALIDNVAK
jgi:ABC-type Fe3+ transport system, periplasmic component